MICHFLHKARPDVAGMAVGPWVARVGLALPMGGLEVEGRKEHPPGVPVKARLRAFALACCAAPLYMGQKSK